MKRLSKTSYKDYKKTQLSRSNSKWVSCTFDEGKWKEDYQKIKEYLKDCYTVCCMGIRYGNEYNVFKENTGMEVYGIDINKRIVDVGDNCFAYDFSNLPKDWSHKFDLIYSNSIDHSFDIKKTIDEWYRVGKKYLWIVLSSAEPSGADVYSFGKNDLLELFDDKRFEIIESWDGVDCLTVFVRIKK